MIQAIHQAHGSLSHCNLKQSMTSGIGNALRDKLFYSDPKKNFAPHVFTDSKKRATFDFLTTKRRWISFDNKGSTYRVEAFIMKTDFKKAKDTHTCVRIGGADEELSLSPVRFHPLLAAFENNTSKRRNLRFIQISPFNIQKLHNGTYEAWKPSHFGGIGDITFPFLKSLKCRVDSLMMHSMGGAALDGLETREIQLVPKTLILDRTIPSVWKLGNKMLNPALCYILYFLSYCSGWAGNPERSLIRFFEKQKGVNLKNRQVVVIECAKDIYFSGKGSFNKDFGKTLRQLGVQAFQRTFDMNPIRLHPRAHHACPIDFLRNKSDKTIKQGNFVMYPNQSVASALARNIFTRSPKFS